MLCRGTGEESAGKIADYFDSIGGSLSAGAGRFSIEASASCLKPDFPKAFSLMAESFVHPKLPQHEFDKVRAEEIAALARHSADPQSEVTDAFYDALPKTSPYHVPPEGRESTLKTLTVAELKAYHARYFIPSRMVVTVFGDIQPDEAVKLVEKHFGEMPSSEEPEHAITGDNAIAKDKTIHKTTNKDTAMVMFGFPCEGTFDKHDHAAMTVLRTILNGYRYPSGWLHNELRGAGLVYYVQSFEMTGPLPGFYCILSQTSPDKADEVVKRIRANLDRAQRGDIPADEFQNAVKQIIALHAEENTTIGEQADLAGMNELLGLGYNYDATFDERIRAVKPEDLPRLAKKVFAHGVLVVCSPGNQK
jgi:zinc protease